mmetsp:Transcript_17327/g.42349  ORF Transcript_17327/g.42349 Transcript_17327/m.42349 type:complete len:136 (-) Transcript_17327:278-685(-)
MNGNCHYALVCIIGSPGNSNEGDTLSMGRGLHTLLIQAASHSSVNVCGLAIDVLLQFRARENELDSQLASDCCNAVARSTTTVSGWKWGTMTGTRGLPVYRIVSIAQHRCHGRNVLTTNQTGHWVEVSNIDLGYF